MSEIDDSTVIANLRETVERLIAERDAWKDTYRRGFDAAKAAAKHVIDFAKVAAGVEEKMSGDNKCSLLVLAIEKEINELEPEVAQ